LYQRWALHFGVDVPDGIGMTEMLHIFLSNRPGAVRPGTTGVAVPGYDPRILDDEGNEVAGHPGHAVRARRLHRDQSRGECGEERVVLVGA
jgi:acyl-coenzyme A synthetase/AMP-(fatty) acid ligase